MCAKYILRYSSADVGCVPFPKEAAGRFAIKNESHEFVLCVYGRYDIRCRLKNLAENPVRWEWLFPASPSDNGPLCSSRRVGNRRYSSPLVADFHKKRRAPAAWEPYLSGDRLYPSE